MATPQLPHKPVLTLQLARLMAETALTAANEKDLNRLVVAIADDGGRLICLLRQDDAEPAAVDIGIAKARTAALFKKATKHWKDTLLEGKWWVLGMPNMTPVEGGQPIIVDGHTIGGIGVAGASGALDTEIGTIALSVLMAKRG